MAHIIIEAGAVKGPKAKRGLGDMIEVFAKPIAKALRMDCLDSNDQLKVESPCAKRRELANKLGKKIGIGVVLLLFAVWPARAQTVSNTTWTADVVVTATDFGLNPQSGAQVTMTPTAPLRRTYGTNLVTATARSLQLSTNGTATFAATLWGNYTLMVPGTTPTTYRLSLGTNSPSPISAAALVQDPQTLPPNPATNYYTMPQVDALIGGVSGTVATNVPVLVAGTNVTIDTNGLVLTINATVGGSGNTTNGLTNIVAVYPAVAVQSNQQVVVSVPDAVTNTQSGTTLPNATLNNAGLWGIPTFYSPARYADGATLANHLVAVDNFNRSTSASAVLSTFNSWWNVRQDAVAAGLTNVTWDSFDSATKALITSLAGSGTNYMPPQVSYMAPAVSAFEIGYTNASTVLTWTLSGATVTNQILNQGIGTINATNRTYTDAAIYSTNRTYTLTVTDGAATNSGSASVSFMYKRYWGLSTNASLTSAQIIALSSELASSFSKTIPTVYPNAQYIYYCYPALWGTASLIVNTFTVTDWTQSSQNFTNAQGYVASYYVYRSPAPYYDSNPYNVTAQ